MKIKTFNYIKRLVATLVDEFKNAGSYSSQFSIRNYQLSSGVYFYQLCTEKYVETKKMMIIK